jgi:sigma-B regulation protein RsbU (phosphoserine phosphatase)
MGLPAFVTSVYGVLDPATGRFQYANCGHSPALLIRKDGKVEKLESDGPPLGLFEDARYQAGEIVLARGDLLLLYTDGVVETARADDSEFGLERLATLACDSRHMSAEAVVSEIVRAAREFSGLATFDDDFTLLAIRRQ